MNILRRLFPKPTPREDLFFIYEFIVVRFVSNDCVENKFKTDSEEKAVQWVRDNGWEGNSYMISRVISVIDPSVLPPIK